MSSRRSSSSSSTASSSRLSLKAQLANHNSRQTVAQPLHPRTKSLSQVALAPSVVPGYPTPSSTFVPPLDDVDERAAIRKMLNSIGKDQKQAIFNALQPLIDDSETSAAIVLADGEGDGDKENVGCSPVIKTPLQSRRSSLSSYKMAKTPSTGGTTAIRAEAATSSRSRRSSAGHPMSPQSATSGKRSRPTSMLITQLATVHAAPLEAAPLSPNTLLLPEGPSEVSGLSSAFSSPAKSPKFKHVRQRPLSDYTPSSCSTASASPTLAFPESSQAITRNSSGYSEASSYEPQTSADQSPAFAERSLHVDTDETPSSSRQLSPSLSPSLSTAFKRMHTRSPSISPNSQFRAHMEDSLRSPRHRTSTDTKRASDIEESEGSDHWVARPRKNTGCSDKSASSDVTAKQNQLSSHSSPNHFSYDARESDASDDARSPRPWNVPVIIRDYAFPSQDPRFVGQPAEPDPINIPPPSSMGASGGSTPWYQGNGFLAAGLDPAQDGYTASILSSSSSSSLSSSFTPPPFGSFGYGHAYHNPQQRGTGQGDLPTTAGSPLIYDWNVSGLNSPHDSEGAGSNQLVSEMPSSSLAPTKYSWAFQTEVHGSKGTPSNSSRALSATMADSPAFSTPPHFGTLSGLSASMGNSAILGSALSLDIQQFAEFDDQPDTPVRASGVASTEGTAEPQSTATGQLYRAMYRFSPEGPPEIEVEEGGKSTGRLR